MKYFIAMYDEADNPYMIFKDYNECAKFFNTSTKVIQCNVCRHQKKKYQDKFYRLYKIYDDEEMQLSKWNIHIGKIVEFINTLREIEKSL